MTNGAPVYRLTVLLSNYELTTLLIFFGQPFPTARIVFHGLTKIYVCNNFHYKITYCFFSDA